MGPLVINPSFSNDSVYGQPGVYLQDFDIRPQGTYAYMYDEPTGEWINIHPFVLPVPTTSGILLSTIDGIDYPLKMVGEYYYGDITIDETTGIYFNGQTPPVTMGRYSTDATLLNLISNPYPSSVNWDTLYDLNSNDVGTKIYVWNPKFQNYGVYIANLSGTLDVSENISLGQAFFVETINPTFTFYNNTRNHSIDPFVKSNPLYSLKIKIIGDEFGDECSINFNEDATYDYDESYDSYKWESYNEFSPEIKTEGDLTINSIPFGNTSVNIFTECNVDGEYYLEFTGTNGFENYNVILEDKETSDFIDLKMVDTYTFNNSITPFENRFVIHFDINTGIPTYETSDINVYSYGKNIYIKCNFDNATVTNTLGSVVYEGAENKININTPGVYFVTIFNNKSCITRKLYIK